MGCGPSWHGLLALIIIYKTEQQHEGEASNRKMD
jgi:hypothetical protein